ncbi:MAG: cyclic nucleotide-binding domain-containing protein [Alphaproteobacteria bacterium]|nr:cyclic nucleotide-binding domain-containing protein [Alphaproteobacteria bacterium]
MSDDLNPKNSGKSQTVLNRQVYYKGDEIIRQGDIGQRAFYIEDGAVEVYIHEGATKLKVASLKSGDIFGEMALITHDPRSATVIATQTSTITIIEHKEIEGRIEAMKDGAIKALIRVLVDRLKEATRGQLAHYKNLEDFQDRITGVVDRVELGIDSSKSEQFRKEVNPLLDQLQEILDRYHK